MNQNTGSQNTGSEKTTENHNGNVDRIQKTAKKAMRDAQPKLDEITSVARTVSEDVVAYVKQRPVAALGIAAGAGFALGSIFGSRLGRLVLVMGAGYAAQELIERSLGEDGLKKLVGGEIEKLVNRSSH